MLFWDPRSICHRHWLNSTVRPLSAGSSFERKLIRCGVFLMFHSFSQFLHWHFLVEFLFVLLLVSDFYTLRSPSPMHSSPPLQCLLKIKHREHRTLCSSRTRRWCARVFSRLTSDSVTVLAGRTYSLEGSQLSGGWWRVCTLSRAARVSSDASQESPPRVRHFGGSRPATPRATGHQSTD
jgi:hypothetical protein